MFDPLSKDALRNPHPMYDRLRQATPVYYDARLKSWIITRYAEALRILRDHRTFTVDFRKVGEPIPLEAISVERLDPPEHGSLRQALARGFHTLDRETLRAGLVKLLAQRLDLAAASGVADFLHEVADPVADYLTTTLLGLPDIDRDAIRPCMALIVDAMDSGLKPEAVVPAARARRNLNELLAREYKRQRSMGLIAWMQQHVSNLVPTPVIVNTLRVILNSFYGSVPKLLANALHAVLTSPAPILRQIRSRDPQHWVREILRYAAPVHAVTRGCTIETDIGGQRVLPNQDVVVLLAAANRDPEVFHDPHALLLDRDVSSALTFGSGVHNCLGAPFATLVLQECLIQIAERFPRTILMADPEPLANAVLRGPASLLIRLRN